MWTLSKITYLTVYLECYLNLLNSVKMEYVSENSEILNQKVADWLLAYSREVLQKQTRFTIALSGGSTPQKLYKLLAREPYRSQIEWGKWHIFWGDERFVPITDNRNNAKMALETLLNHVPIPTLQIHVFNTNLDPETAAAHYETLLHQYFNEQNSTFDLVLLGMGDDGHTLSLFPNTAVVNEEKSWVKAFYLEPQAMFRITLTAPVVNKAACVAFLITGEKKAEVLQQVRQGKYQPDLYPSQRIKPANGNLIWFLDEAAKLV